MKKTLTATEGRAITFGLRAEENQLVQDALPTKGYVLLATGEPTDLIAISAQILVICAGALDAEDRDWFFDYYTEIGGSSDETVFWLGEPKPPKNLTMVFRCYDSFDAFAAKLKYHLLTAHNRSRKARDYSDKLADCLQILSLIRSRKFIKTQELAERIGKPTRTIQRYIATLRAAGEAIEFDQVKKSWYLQCGKSIFFGDYFGDL